MSTKVFPIITRENLLEIFAVVCLFRDEKSKRDDTPQLRQTTVSHVLTLLVKAGTLPQRRAEVLLKNKEFAKMFDEKTRMSYAGHEFVHMQNQLHRNGEKLFLGHMQSRDFSHGNAQKKPEEMLTRTPLQLTNEGIAFAHRKELSVARFLTKTVWEELYRRQKVERAVTSAGFAAKAQQRNIRVWGEKLAP